MNCAPAPQQRTETFSVARDGLLVRAVVPRRRRAYEHRCTLETPVAVCHRFDEHGEGDTVETIAEAEILTTDKGLVVACEDGTEYQLTIVRSR